MTSNAISADTLRRDLQGLKRSSIVTRVEMYSGSDLLESPSSSPSEKAGTSILTWSRFTLHLKDSSRMNAGNVA